MIDLYSFEYHIYVMKNNAEFGEALCKKAPKIEMVSDAKIKKSMSGSFIFPDGIDILNDTLSVQIIVNGKKYSFGEYYIGTYIEKNNEYGQVYLEIEAYDGGYLPNRHRTENILHLSFGENYVDTIKMLLISCGIEKIEAIPNNAVLANDREDWELGTPYIDIINALLSEINYESLWFDNSGYAKIGPKKSADPNNIRHKYVSGKYSIISANKSKETDVFNKYNIFIAYVDSADNDGIMIATAANEDPSSLLSVQNRGRIQAPPKRLDNIANQQELQSYVDNWRNKSMVSTEIVSITTQIDEEHEVLDTVQCEDDLYLEYSWSIDLSNGPMMNHTLKKESII